MASDSSARSHRGNPGGMAGAFWFAGWLFTIAFARLVWWKALLALILWPYFLGVAAR